MGKRIFGDHKTIRGFISGTFMGMVSASILYFFYPAFFVALPAKPLMLGFLLGLGALTGDAVKSFFKRRIGTAPGEAWFPFDQIDYIVGAIVASFFYVRLSLYFYFLALIVFFLLHIIVTYIGYRVRLKAEPI
jgi:CDP-2,3-bis-(O-geranylgeranyl)-sn-glycerol synthase